MLFGLPLRSGEPLHGINKNLYDRLETREFLSHFDTELFVRRQVRGATSLMRLSSVYRAASFHAPRYRIRHAGTTFTRNCRRGERSMDGNPKKSVLNGSRDVAAVGATRWR